MTQWPIYLQQKGPHKAARFCLIKKFGYNYFVGDNKPNDSKHLLKYQTAKAESNANRAVGGTLRRKENSKNLPPNIN